MDGRGNRTHMAAALQADKYLYIYCSEKHDCYKGKIELPAGRGLSCVSDEDVSVCLDHRYAAVTLL